MAAMEEVVTEAMEEVVTEAMAVGCMEAMVVVCMEECTTDQAIKTELWKKVSDFWIPLAS